VFPARGFLGHDLDVGVLQDDEAAAEEAAAESVEVAAQPFLALARPQGGRAVPFGDGTVAADELAGVPPGDVAGAGEQRLEVAADRRLAPETLAP
jgi:hypothetical protein